MLIAELGYWLRRPHDIQTYNLRRRTHDRQMPEHTGHLADKNFLIRACFLRTRTSGPT